MQLPKTENSTVLVKSLRNAIDNLDIEPQSWTRFIEFHDRVLRLLTDTNLARNVMQLRLVSIIVMYESNFIKLQNLFDVRLVTSTRENTTNVK